MNMKKKIAIICFALILCTVIGIIYVNNYIVADTEDHVHNYNNAIVKIEGNYEIKSKYCNICGKYEGTTEIVRYLGNETSLVIPTIINELTVTSIGEGAFIGNTSLSDVTIPNSVTSIGPVAFYNCPNLKMAIIPESVTTIDTTAFESCYNLMIICLRNSTAHTFATNNNIPYVTYEYNSDDTITISDCGGNITSLEIPSTIEGKQVISIGEYAFAECISLTNIKIPSGVTSVGNYAFTYCTNLTSITIPNSVTSIGEGAFSYCTNLTDITIPSGVTSISSSTFAYCTNLANVTIPSGVTSIGNSAFKNCKNLVEIRLPDTVQTIGSLAFMECSRLTRFTIPSGITSIGDLAFYKCESLTDITIPTSVKTLEYATFAECTNLTNVTIPNTVATIADDVFYGCNNLTITCIKDSAAHNYAVDNGINYVLVECEHDYGNLTTHTEGDYIILAQACNKCGKYLETDTTIYRYIGSATTLDIPSQIAGLKVTYIAQGAFQGCTSLSNVTIPNTVNQIAISTFSGCTNLSNIVIPNTITNIKDNAFNGCTSLNNVIIPDSVTDIGGFAFSGCTNLIKIIIPESVENIHHYAFSNTNENLTIYCKKDSAAYNYAVAENINYVFVVPVTMVEYNPTITTNETVTVTISAGQEIKEVEGWTLIDGTMLRKTYSENKEETVVIKPKYDQEELYKHEVSISVKNIEKRELTLKVNNSETEPTHEEVKVTITGNIQLEDINDWTLSEDKYSLSKKYTSNAKETVKVKDILGNEKTVEIVVNNIYPEHDLTQATCKVASICKICGVQVGNVDSDNHSNYGTYEGKITVEPTETTYGKQELICNGCKTVVDYKSIAPTGGETEDPSQGEETDKPSQGEETDKPSQGEETDKPSQGEETDKPSQGEETDKPSQGEETDKPNQGEGVDADNSENEKMDTDNKQNNNQNLGSKDDTTADGKIPQTGDAIMAIGLISTILIFGVVSFIKYRKYNKYI